MPRVKFSIIVVCLNAGEKLHKTLDSVLCQSFRDYEILVKDGGSTDGSLPGQTPAIRVHVQPDCGIYDAMNQAVALAEGEYFLFLNCGDYLADTEVLAKTAAAIDNAGQDSGDKETSTVCGTIFYGNLYQRALGTQVYSCSGITPFTCYRNIPCHQTCFYHRTLFAERAYDLKYPVRADYEHFLYCYFTRKARTFYLPFLVSSYEGGGYSETKQHLKAAKREHREITRIYFSKSQLFLYRLIMLLTLQPLRTFAANNRLLAGLYNKCKGILYKK